MDIPLGLISSMVGGNCVLFLGSGIGYNATDRDGRSGPTGYALMEKLAAEYDIPFTAADDLMSVSQLIEIKYTRDRLVHSLESILADLNPDQSLAWLLSLPWRAIFTTNYDQLIEKCYEGNPNPVQSPIVMGANSETASWNPPFEVPVIHLHGSFRTDEAKQAILITRHDYARFRERRGMLFDHLRLQFATVPILYVGYSNLDQNWQTIVQEVATQFYPNQPPSSYRLTPDTSDNERTILSASGIQTIDGTLAEFHDYYVQAVGGADSQLALPSLTSSNWIPADFAGLNETSPVATARLLNSWEYVNQASFDETPNTDEFHRGDRPNWGLLGSGINFERDIESVIVERLIDFGTEPSPKARCEILLAPAGYGITTTLMAIGAWYVRNRVGTTLLLRPGQTILVGDLEFATKNLLGPVVFIIDNAADHEKSLDEGYAFLRDSKIGAMLLLGERTNEWRQAHPRIKPREHEVEALSDGEISRLISSLEATGSLGHLEGLSAPLRIAAIRERNQKELLVTMREVTEGRAFDAIIEDEYLGIHDERAKELYNLICTFTRVKALARDFLCFDALDSDHSQVLDLIRGPLGGVVRWVTIDESRGIEALQARHRVIADIVWDRCMTSLQRQDSLQNALKNLNLTFGVDAKAFEAFTRDDETVDSLGSLDAKTAFFEEACRRDTENAYVRQHYARMLRRETRLELALSQIERASQLRPNARAIQHTRGVILGDMSVAAPSPELARKRLAQSEDAFRRALRANKRDEYSYRSLSELYLRWARRDGDGANATTFASKAQEVVLQGLENARNLEGLYLASADIENFFGNTPERLESLRAAVSSNPSSRVARYLLGNVLRIEKIYDEAKEVLLEGLRIQPEDPYLALAYSRTLHECGEPVSSSLAVLRLAELAGQRDPRFVATFGGLLTLAKEFDAAKVVWQRSVERNFAARDRDRINFIPLKNGEDLSAEGSVVKVGTGFAFISAVGYPDFHCGGSQFSGLVLRRGMPVTFVVGFSARGPVGLRVRLRD